MLKVGKICTLFLIIAAMTAGSVPAMAESAERKPGKTNAWDHPGTEFNIVTFHGDITNISFTVPLYVTMVVTEGEAQVDTPTNYRINNNSTEANWPIAVVKMSFKNTDDHVYNTVKEINETSAKNDIFLKIGGLSMVSEKADGDIPIEKGSTFRELDGSYKEIRAGESLLATASNALPIPVEGKVSDRWMRETENATEQFKVAYTVSPLFLGKPLKDHPLDPNGTHSGYTPPNIRGIGTLVPATSSTAASSEPE